MTKLKAKHLFFDLDHTLWDFDKNSALTFLKIFEMNALSVDISEFTNVYEPINLNYWKLYRNAQIQKKQLRYGRLKDAFDALGFNIDDALIWKLSEDYIAHLSTFNHLFVDTLDVLSYLKPNYKLHIITNGFDEAQNKKLINSGLKPYFTTITNSEMAGVKKPNPKIFNFALQQANALASQSIMIGDSIEADIEGAQGVGIKAILFDSKNQYTDYKDLRIITLNTLKQLL